VAVAVGDNEQDLFDNVDKIWEYYNNNFNIAVVPSPDLSAEVGDRKVSLLWSNELDISYENPAVTPPENDLDGYIVYRTTDQTLRSWQVLDTVAMVFKDDSVFDARAYEYVDNSGVYNGFKYFYNLSAYRKTPLGIIEESPRLSDINNLDNQPNAIAVTPSTLPAQTENDMDRIKVVPNPFIISAQWDESRVGNTVFGEPVRNIAFTHLPSTCTIKIFTVDGDLVKTLEHRGTTGREEWNLLTSENRPAVSGVYFFHVESDLGEKVGRFAIIR
jgi:hypothetical protein